MNNIDKAFATVKREDFLPVEVQSAVAFDTPLPIGFGQTNSQPTTVRLMLEWLEPQPGDKVLDIGSGSGWTTALLSSLVGPQGQVYAVEKVPELVDFGAENARRAGVRNARFFKSGDTFGLPEYGPYDRILVSASADRLPDELLYQLKTGGKLVMPVGYSVLIIQKEGQDKYEIQEHPGFVFVPLVK